MFPLFFKALMMLVVLVGCGQNRNFKEIDDRAPESSSTSSTLGLGKGAIHSKYGWQHRIDFYVTDSMPEVVVDGYVNAAKAWNDAIGKTILQYKGRTNSHVPESLYASLDDDQFIIYYDDKWKQHTKKSTLTLATTVWENAVNNVNVIVKADVIMNAENYAFGDMSVATVSSQQGKDQVDAQTVATHEFGHALGLDHTTNSEDPDSVMHAQTPIGPGFTFRTLSDGDVKNVRSIYERFALDQ